MYFPKNRIKTGFNSNGELLVKSTNKPYFGPYFETSKGKYYAGNTPNYANLVELIQQTKVPPAEFSEDSGFGDPRFNYGNNLTYSTNQGIEEFSTPQQLPPKYYNSEPTNEQYRQGEYIRYFAKKTNEYIYIEIDKKTYYKLKSEDPTILWTLYDCLYMIYSLRSNEVNRKLALQIEKQNQWYGFLSYLNLNLNTDLDT